jgi:hypothetical protein
MTNPNLDNYDIGTSPTITGEFRNLARALADPTTVVVQYRTPDGNQQSLSAASTEVGIWTVLLPVLEEPGIHSVRFIGTGVVAVANTITFRVDKTNFINPP